MNKRKTESNRPVAMNRNMVCIIAVKVLQPIRRGSVAGHLPLQAGHFVNTSQYKRKLSPCFRLNCTKGF